MAGIRLFEQDFIDVTVNAEVPRGKGKFTVVTFDARFLTVGPEEMEEVVIANQRGERGVLIDFLREKLISTDGINDFEKKSADVIALDESLTPNDGEDETENAREHKRTLELFIRTFPLPIDAVTAFMRNQTKAGFEGGKPKPVKGTTKN